LGEGKTRQAPGRERGQQGKKHQRPVAAKISIPNPKTG
jgi:hypothetical protein